MHERVSRVRPRARQSDRRAHRLQRRPRAAVRDRRGRHGRGRRRRGDDRIDGDRRPTWAPRTRSRSRAPDRVRGWRAFARGLAAELQRAGVELRRARLRDHRDRPARARACRPRRRSRSRCAWRCWRSAEPRSPDRIELAHCARGSRTSGSAPRPACWTRSPRCAASAGSALRIDFRTLEVTPRAARARRLRAGHARLGRAPRQRRRRGGGTRSPATTGAAPSAPGRASCSGSTACATPRSSMAASLPEPLAARARHVVTENAARAATPWRRCTTATSSASASC